MSADRHIAQYLNAVYHSSKCLSRLQHSSENYCERVLPDCPIHGLQNDVGLVKIPIVVASLVCQELCASSVLVHVVSGKGGGGSTALTGISSGGMYCSPSMNSRLRTKHHMTPLLFCLPHYRIVFFFCCNFSGILFADAKRKSF